MAPALSLGERIGTPYYCTVTANVLIVSYSLQSVYGGLRETLLGHVVPTGET